MGIEAEQIETARGRLLQVFEFLRAFNQLRNPVKRQVKEQPWLLWLRDLPAHPSIHPIFEASDSDDNGLLPDGQEEDELREGTRGDGSVLKVQRPRLTPAPTPPPELQPWLLEGWDDPRKDVQIQTSLPPDGAESMAAPVRFDADPERLRVLSKWRLARDEWGQIERPARAAMRVFERLYDLHAQMERESEQVELVLGDGILNWRRPEGGVHHPIILESLQLEFDPDVPEFTLRGAERPVELYSAVFRSIPEVDGRVVARLRRELEGAGYHPLGGSETSAFLQRVVTQLSPRGEFVGDVEPGGEEDYPRMGRSPVIFLRRRSLGFAAAIDAVLEDLPTQEQLPSALLNIVGVESGPASEDEASEDGQIVEEDAEILLSKAANREQLQIARRLERHRAVLVQGPPGTGKTHTIANLIGHLLAEGKRILVTSHTTKALRVLREQVEPELQPLCVSVLESDIDSRRQLEASVQAIVERLSSADRDRLDEEAGALIQQRRKLIQTLKMTREALLRARADEYRDVVVAGESHSPSDAARLVAVGRTRDDWIPAPVAPGAPMPLSASEIEALYETNGVVSPEDERELSFSLPSLSEMESPDDFDLLVRVLGEEPEKERWRQFWKSAAEEQEREGLEELLRCSADTVEALGEEPGWRLAAMHAGRLGGVHREPWENLVGLIEDAYQHAASTRELILRHGPSIQADTPYSQQAAVLSEIVEHMEKGHRLARLTMLRNAPWKRLISTVRVNGQPPKTLEEFVSLRGLAMLEQKRQDLQQRWERQMTPLGATSLAGEKSPETTAIQFVHQISDALAWNESVMRPLEEMIVAAGFRWDRLLDTLPPHDEQVLEPLRLRVVVLEHLQPALEERTKLIRRKEALKRHEQLREMLAHVAGSHVVDLLAGAVSSLDKTAYREGYERLHELQATEKAYGLRCEMLEKLAEVAPGWADAIRNREGPHGGVRVPGNCSEAWLWSQLNDELDARSQTSLEQLQENLVRLKEDLQRTTAALVNRMAWRAQLDRTSLPQRKALMGWLLTVRRLGKRTGKRAPRLMVEARKLMGQSRDAVPVWIMPLSRVVENFDPRGARFDVLVIDEASQCDALALIAIYMARSVVIVGDDQQVSPDAVGQRIEEVENLIREHLQGIPNAVLYDGQQSVYDLAMQSFGGLVCLREHFRCAPDIIQFSNDLSYDGQIKPLRDGAQIPLKPHVFEYRVEGFEGEDNVNEQEGLQLASLVAAALEEPEYAGKTVGVVSLLGEEQARFIDQLLREHVPPAEYEGRRIISGNAAHFQGDQRDVMFLSVVHGPSSGPLRLLEAGPSDRYKKRFNVAASRARDQMWVVHSLNPEVDLQVGDLRRRLIEHARDPSALMRRIEQQEVRTESPFEAEVMRRLVTAGFRVVAQYQVGYYRIDLVVEGAGKRVAVECDGDRYHTLDRLGEDMERQAILERMGWTFVRLRGTEFFRNPDATMERVIGRLRELGVQPDQETPEATDRTGQRSEVIDRIIRRAAELRASWEGGRYSQVVEASPTDESPLRRPASPREPKRQPPAVVIESPPARRVDSARSGSAPKLPDRAAGRNVHPSFWEATPTIPGSPAEKRSVSGTPKLATGSSTGAGGDFDLASFLRERGVDIVDKRSKGGAMWVIGGPELRPLMAELRAKGIRFQFAERGGRATRYRPAWFTSPS